MEKGGEQALAIGSDTVPMNPEKSTEEKSVRERQRRDFNGIFFFLERDRFVRKFHVEHKTDEKGISTIIVRNIIII